MPLSWDSEVLDGAVLFAAKRSEPLPEIERGDWKALRTFGDASSTDLELALSPCSSIARQDFSVPSYDGTEILVRWYSDPENDRGCGAALYLHGGGMIMGSVEKSDRSIAGYVERSGVPMLAVDYRLAPEHPHPTPVEDCLAALAWLHDNVKRLGIDHERLAVMGESAGGGLAAATSFAARDRDLPVAQQILIYPMLDDRTVTVDPQLVDFAVWTYDNNYTGWHALLGGNLGGPNVTPYAAPARATDFANLPDTYIEVGELDIFRDESIEFARRLLAAGCSVDLHVHRGCPHGFDRIAPGAGVSLQAGRDRTAALRRVS